MAPPIQVLELFAIWLNIIVILVTTLIEIPFRPWIRVLRRFPPNRWSYRLMKMANNAQGRAYARLDMLESIFALVTWFSRWWESRNASEHYNANIAYVPSLKVSRYSEL